MQEIAKAIIEVTKAVKGVEKNSTVGVGKAQYKGVNDKDVKEIMRKAMADHGLSILPIDIDAKTEVSRWEEKDQYGTKQKQSVFTEVKTRYLLLHTSGESIELTGYGHGVDSQDKGAGKATTYALKYALLYSFLVPTGQIDDSDDTHSDEHEIPAARQNKPNSHISVDDAFKKIGAVTSEEELNTVYRELPSHLKFDEEVIAKCKEVKKVLQNNK